MEQNAEPQEYMKSLHGLEFPASKSGIVRKAHDTGGIDTEVIHVLGLIDDRTYETPEDLSAEVERIYKHGGALGNGGPAAPSEATAREKDLIKSLADPRANESH